MLLPSHFNVESCLSRLPRFPVKPALNTRRSSGVIVSGWLHMLSAVAGHPIPVDMPPEFNRCFSFYDAHWIIHSFRSGPIRINSAIFRWIKSHKNAWPAVRHQLPSEAW